MNRQVGGESSIERIALVVVKRDVVEPAIGADRIFGIGACEPADDGAALLGYLIRIGDVKLADVRQLRRAQRQFPCTDQCSIHRDRKIHVGLAEIGVIEEIVDAILHGRNIEEPSLVRNLNAELVFFIPLRGDGGEGVLPGRQARCVIEYGTRHSFKRRGLKEVAIEAAQHPAKFRNFNSCADARVVCGLVQARMETGETHATEQGEILAKTQMIRNVAFEQCGPGVGCSVGLRGGAAVVDQYAEEVIFRLVKGVKAAGEIVGAGVGVEIGLSSNVIRALMPCSCDRVVIGGLIVIGLVEVIERRDGK